MARVVNLGAEALSKGEYKLIPTGTKLRVTLYEVEETVTGANAKVGPGKEQLVYTAKVVEDGEFKGREIRYNYVPLHGLGNDKWKLATFAEAIGLSVSDDGEIELPDAGGFTEYLGTEFVARIGQQKSNKINEATGEPYVNNTISGTLPLSAYKGKPAAAEKPAVDPWAK